MKSLKRIEEKEENISAKAIVGDADISDVVATISKAEIALQSIVNIRDKVIAAYQDVMKMQM
jgi:flagellar hook-basal body complex protein FliE